MSWGGGSFGSVGSSGTSGASTAGGSVDAASGAGSIADAGSGAGMTGDAAGSFGGAIGSTNIYGQMADVGGNSSTTFSGFDVDAASNLNTGMGPTTNTANMQTYGTTNPSFMDKAVNTLEQFQKGSNQSLPEAYEGWGNNAKTYGYIAGKVAGMAAGAGGNQRPPDVTTNVNYQQPQNDYLRKRRGY